MKKIEIEIHENIISVLAKLKEVEDVGIELIIPKGAVIFENIINLKLIKNWSDKTGKVIHFDTDDDQGQNLILSLEDKTPNEVENEELETHDELPKKKRKMLPAFSLPKPRFAFKGKKVMIITLLLLVLGIGGYIGINFLSELPTANVNIVVNSQSLTRSIQLRVENNTPTNATDKILEGETINTSLEEIITIETTGEKLTGEKAEGKVDIYNNTDEEKKFDKGTVLKYEEKDLEFVLKDDVTIPARELEPGSTDPNTAIYIKGKKEAEIEAREFGKQYNLDKDEELEIDDEDKKDFVAIIKKDLEGGSEETVNVVAQEDIDKIKEEISKQVSNKIEDALKKDLSGGSKLISGSEKSVITKEEYSHELNEETDELTLTQSIKITGLTYVNKDLDELIDQLVQDFVPEGFVIYSKERVVNVEILGETEITTLTDVFADIQVTLKTFVVPDISADTIKENLLGKSVDDAQKYLGSVRNVKTYELNLSPRIPFFDNIPNDKNRILVQLERE